jgi:hypothetical protein
LSLLQLGQHALSLVCHLLAYRRTVAFGGSEKLLGLEGSGLAHTGDSCFGFGSNGLRLQVSRRQQLLGIGLCVLPQLKRILLTALSQSVQLGQLSVPQLRQFRGRGLA